ncbi:MAG: LysR family transcriptional regulator [Pseudomonadota bacterium]
MNKIEQPPLNSDLLRSFVVIAQTGNLTHAADRLGRTQSAISVQLRNLEESLGAVLFDRSVKGMALTDAGERLLPKAEAAVAELQEMRGMFEAPLTGTLSIGIPDDYEGHILTDALARFARVHPGVEVTARSGCTASYADEVRAGRLDMAICSGPKPLGTSPMSKEPAVWATSQLSHVHPDEPVPLAMLDRSCWWKSIPTDALRAAGRAYRVSFRTESFGSLVSALRSDFAIGVLPASCVDEGLQVLGTAEGLPVLPDIHRSVLFSEAADTALTQAMAEAINATLPGRHARGRSGR